MKLTINGEELILPKDFEFRIEQHHPFFSDEGASTVPVTLPASYDNLRILGRPDNINSAKRHIRKHDAIFTSGAFQQRCTLLSESVDEGEGISASLALYESELYAKSRDLRLCDLCIGTGATSREFSLWPLYHGQSNFGTHVAIFPVATDVDSEGMVVGMLNEPLENDFNWDAREITLNGETFDVPSYYGCTIFLYLYAAIDIAFQSAGYEVAYNVFEEDEKFRHIVLLNNSADVIKDIYNSVGRPLLYEDYSYMVPDITLGELIAFLHDAFGAYVICKQNQIYIYLLERGVDSNLDIAKYARKGLKITYPESKSLSYAFNTSIESATPIDETLEQFRADYTAKEVDSYEDIEGSGLYYIKPLGKYYYYDGKVKTMKGTDCFKYARTINETDAEEISCENCFVPMVYVKDSGRYMPYIGARVHRVLDFNKENSFKQPIMMCYAHFDEHYSGSSYPYYEDGTSVEGRLPLTPEGLKGNWSTYERILVNGAPQIDVKLDMPLEVLKALDFSKVYLFHGIRCFIRSLSYSLSDNGISEVQAVLQVLPEYTDAVEIPDYSFADKYTWAHVITLPKITEYERPNGEYCKILKTDGMVDYTLEDAPKVIPERKGIISKHRSRYVTYERHYRRPNHRPGGGYDWFTQTVTATGEEYFISK